MANVDITVGKGDVTYIGYATQALSWLGALAALITTLSGNLPDGLGPEWGIGLTVASGVVGLLIQAVTAFTKAKFAQSKALVLAGQGAAGYDVFVDSVDLDPDTPTDTDVEPPVEPVS